MSKTSHSLRPSPRHAVSSFERLESRQLLTALAHTPIVPLSPSSAATSAISAPLHAAPQPAGIPLTGINLNSKPGATRTIYLDFNGHITSGTAWNTEFTAGVDIVTPAFDMDSDPTTFSPEEVAIITEAWQWVSEDYAPFDVNVTTQDPGVAALVKAGGLDVNYGVRVVIGGSSLDWLDSGPVAVAAGVGYLDTFQAAADIPVFVFQEETNNIASQIAGASSHEVGHSLNLVHDGTFDLEYYSGHGNWSPIMGAGYTSLSQWSQGEYGFADNFEDDLAIIISHGLSFRTDDAGDKITDAVALPISSGTNASISGIISTPTDLDFYSFSVGEGGNARINLNPAAIGANLDILANLYDASGTLIATSNPIGALNAFFDLSLPAGSYYISVDGTGEGDPATTGYSDYGSLGQYSIDVTVAAFDTSGPTITSITGAPPRTAGAVFALDVTFSEPININTLTFADMSLTLNGGANLLNAGSGIQVSHMGGSVYRITSFSALSNPSGEFVFSINPQGVTDQSGNIGVGEPATITWVHDAISPVLTSIQNPASPRTTQVSSITIAFDEAIDLATFTWADLSLTLDGGPNLITPASGISIIQLSDTSYSINGLSPLTNNQGVYLFKVNTNQIADLAGNPGATTSLNATWTRDNQAPQVLSFDAIQTPRNTSIDSLLVNFDETIDLATISFADMSLTLNGGANLLTAGSGITVTHVSGATYSINGLLPLTAAPGGYLFTLSATGIADPLGNTGGATKASIAWSRLSSAPVVKAPIGAIAAFEDVNPASITLTNVFTDPYQDPSSLIFNIQSNSNPGLVSLNITGTTLSFVLAPDASGTATITLSATNNDKLTSTDTFTLTVDPVNEKPSFTGSSVPAVNEDAGQQTVSSWASFYAGQADEAGQTATYLVSAVSLPSLFAVAPAIDSKGNLTYTPAANAFGSSTFTVRVKDSGGTAGGGVDTSDAQTFTITVNPVNDAPGFTAPAIASVNEDAGVQTVSGWAVFNAGPINEIKQTALYSVSAVSNTSLFSVLPAVAPDGTLTYTPAANANGSATFKLQVRDSGGTANGGLDASGFQTFTITVNPINDAPVILAVNPPAVNEDAGPQSIPGWAAFAAGPANEAGQTIVNYSVTSLSNSALFSTLPAVSPDGTLTYTPAPNAFGTATFKLQLKDSGGAANGGIDTSAIHTFTITVNSVGDAPVIGSLNLGAAGYAGLDAARFTVTGVTDIDSPVAGVSFYHDLNKNNIADFSELLGAAKNTSGTTWTLDLYAPTAPIGANTILAVATDTTGTSSAPLAANLYIYRSIDSNKAIQYVDSRGNTVKISITGGGNLKAYFTSDGDADPARLLVEGASTAKSSVTVSVTKGKLSSSSLTTIGDISVLGGLLSFSGAKVDLTGNFSSTASVKALTLNDVGDDAGQQIITLGGAASEKTALTFGRLSNVTLSSTSTLAAVKALDWQDTDATPDTLMAPGMASLTVSGRAASAALGLAKLNGDLEASINLSTAVVIGAKTSPALTVSVAGSSQGNWNLRAHKLTTATIKGNVVNSAWSTDGGIGSVTISGSASGLLIDTTAHLTSFKAGQVSHSSLKIAGVLGSLTAIEWLGGQISASKTGAISTSGRAASKTAAAIPGDFAARILVSGVATANTKSVASIAIKGAALGDTDQPVDWQIAGSTGAITAGSTKNLRVNTSNNGANPGNVASFTVSGLSADTALDIAGNLGAVTVGSAQNLTVETNGNLTSFSAKGQAHNTSLHSQGAIGAVTAINFLGGSILADKIGVLTTKGQTATATLPAIPGNFTADLTLTGQGVAAKANALASASIAGLLSDSVWRIHGNAGAISVGAIADSSIFVGVSALLDASAAPTVKAHFQNPTATLAGFTVTGKAVANPNLTTTFTNSRIAAGILAKVTLKLVDTASESSVIAAATKITTYARQNGPKVTNILKVANKTAPGIYDTVEAFNLTLVP